MPVFIRDDVVQERYRHKDETEIDMQALLRDLQAIPIGNPKIARGRGLVGNEYIRFLRGMYHIRDCTVRLNYVRGNFLDTEATGRISRLKTIKNTLDQTFQ